MTGAVRGWLADATSAASLVADRAALWIPGALAWLVTVGWLPLLLVVARPPNVADLTFLGGRLAAATLWPWNVLLICLGALLALALAVVLVALAEAALSTLTGRPLRSRAVVRLVAIGLVTVTPAVLAVIGFAIGFALVAPQEFTSPRPGDPLLRTLDRVAPFVLAIGAAWLAGSLLHAAASRAVVLNGAGVVRALRTSLAVLAGAGPATLLQALAVVVLRVVYFVLATLLLGVLWAPIGARLASAGLDAAHLPLLVGFTAIWLCLVLGGGALHAWGSVSWTRFLGRARTHGDPDRP